MKNVSMMAQKSQLPHMSATQRRMRSRFTVADDLKSSSKYHKSKNNFRRSSKYQSEATMKNQRLRANQVKRMLKTKELKRSKGYPAKDSSSSDY